MVEPSPPALHLLSGGDVSMAGVGVKIEQEEESSGGLMTNAEPLKTSPSRDWSGIHPLEARQLTPPLSCSPSVRHNRVRKVVDRQCRKCRKCHRIICQSKTYFSLFCSDASSVEGSLSVSWQEGSPGKELLHRQSPMGLKEARTDRPEGQSNFKEGLCKHLTWSLRVLSHPTCLV